MYMNAKIINGDSRNLTRINDNEVDLIITSPPYWQIKDYEHHQQIGYGQNLHQYLKDLYRVWAECYRVLKPGRRLCINIGDQFARSIIYGRYKIIPLHSEMISQCENIGLDFMGSIIWQKKTTMNTTGGAAIMGSYPYPSNGMIEIDYEHILIFKKPGDSIKMDPEIKKQSAMTKEEWKEYFSGHWTFGGARQLEHQAMFPEELPLRLVKMFSFVEDLVFDPFLGSGTTMKVALENGRNAIGYEVNSQFLGVIKTKIGFDEQKLIGQHSFSVLDDSKILVPEKDIEYVPNIQNADCKIEPQKLNFKERTYKVTAIEGSDLIVLDTGLKVKLLGVKIDSENTDKVLQYLKEFVLKKEVIIKFDKNSNSENKETIAAYVYLKNKIFINLYLIKSGLAKPDITKEFDQKEKFIKSA